MYDEKKEKAQTHAHHQEKSNQHKKEEKRGILRRVNPKIQQHHSQNSTKENQCFKCEKSTYFHSFLLLTESQSIGFLPDATSSSLTLEKCPHHKKPR